MSAQQLWSKNIFRQKVRTAIHSMLVSDYLCQTTLYKLLTGAGVHAACRTSCQSQLPTPATMTAAPHKKNTHQTITPTCACLLQTRASSHPRAGIIVPSGFYPPSLLLPWSCSIPGGGVGGVDGGGGRSQPGCLGFLLHIAGLCCVDQSSSTHTRSHTPLNASLLLQHIIFADHKIHPHRFFPGRTWH